MPGAGVTVLSADHDPSLLFETTALIFPWEVTLNYSLDTVDLKMDD
jgi:hypothetical protein